MPSTVKNVRVPLGHEADDRFVVMRTTHGWSIDVVGKDPDTRYVPRQESLVRRVLHRLSLGFKMPR